MRLKNRVALITGSSRGIGREIALSFGLEGAVLALNYNSSVNQAKSLLKELDKIDCVASLFQANISNENEAKKMISNILDKYNRIDILVNNAGILTKSLLKNMTVELWDEMISINLRSTFLCTRYVINSMIRNRWKNYQYFFTTRSKRRCWANSL